MVEPEPFTKAKIPLPMFNYVYCAYWLNMVNPLFCPVHVNHMAGTTAWSNASRGCQWGWCTCQAWKANRKSLRWPKQLWMFMVDATNGGTHIASICRHAEIRRELQYRRKKHLSNWYGACCHIIHKSKQLTNHSSSQVYSNDSWQTR